MGLPPSYDIALCSLVLHHFSDDDAVKLFRRSRELSQRFALVSDLRRGFLLRTGVYMLTEVIFREPMTRFDARLSAQRAFSFAEMRDLAGRVGWENFGHKNFGSRGRRFGCSRSTITSVRGRRRLLQNADRRARVPNGNSFNSTITEGARIAKGWRAVHRRALSRQPRQRSSPKY